MNGLDWKTGKIRLAAVFAVATILAMAGTFQYGEKFSHALSYWYLWAVTFPLIRYITRRFPFRPQSKMKSLFIYIAAGVFIAIFHPLLHAAVVNERLDDNLFASNCFDAFFLYGTMLTLCLALDFYRKAREARIQSALTENGIAQSQIQSMKMQFDPDFIHTKLNRISHFIHTDFDQAESYIVLLGDYLRINLELAEAFEVTLREELRFVECYLQIENSGTRNTVQIDWDIDGDAWECRFPSLLLQASIEDAIGRSEKGTCIALKITIRKMNSNLVVTIAGPITSLANPESPRLKSLLNRLNAFYRPSIEQQCVMNANDITTQIQIPLDVEDKNAQTGSEYSESNFVDRIEVSSPVRKWLLITGVFTLLAGYFTVQNFFFVASSGGYINWPLQLIHITGWYIWALITPLILKLSARFPFEQGNLLKSLGIHAGGFILAWLCSACGYAAVQWSSNLGLDSYLSELNLFRYFGFDLVAYATIVATENAVRYHRKFEMGKLRAIRLSSEFTRARLQALKMQLQPHFLFNALNSLSQLIREDSTAAEEMLRNLEKFLLLTWRSESQEISLEEELEFLRCYLSIETVRFQDRLRVQMEIEPDVLQVLVPNLILQPIVENAIKYGVAPRIEPGEIKIRVAKNDGFLHISIQDDGPGFQKSKNRVDTERTGLGVSNTRERLAQLYGGNHRFDFHDAAKGGLLVSLKIPLRYTEPAQHRKAS